MLLTRVPVGAVALGLAIGAACTGSIDPSAGGGPGAAPNAPSNGSPSHPTDTVKALPPLGDGPFAPDRTSDACRAIDPGPSPIRRLTRGEYDNAVRDLLGDGRHLGRGFPGEETALGFHNGAESRPVS